MADPFIDEQDLSDHLGRDVTTDDGAVMAVDAACDIVRTISEQTFNRGTTTEVFDGTGTDALLLSELPVNSIGTVEVFNGDLTWSTAGSADFTLNRDGMLLATNTAGTSGVGTTWPRGRQNISVTYDHGYELTDIPRDIRQVALNIAARIVVQGPALEETSGDQRIKYATAAGDLATGEKMILRKYRRCR